MRICSRFFAAVLAMLVSTPVLAADKVQPVRMGCGTMTFDTVPGWGLRPDGKSALGPTHGSVVIDKAGKIRAMLDATSKSQCERLVNKLQECLAEEPPKELAAKKEEAEPGTAEKNST